VNDELPFEPFPFDFDFIDSFPLDDFTLTNDPGFPRFWENIDDIIGGPLDLLGKIGEMFKDLWDSAWRGLGGAVRWVYEKLDDTLDWLWRQLIHVRESIFQWGDWWFNWMWSRADWAARGIYGGVRGAFDWLHGKVAWWGGAVRDWVEDWAGWLWDTASWGARGIYGGVRGAFDWLHGKVAWWGGAVRDWVEDWAEWLWSTASWGAKGIYGGVRGAFDWLHGKVAWWGGALRDWVQDWAEWTWSTASSAYFGITGGVVGGLIWVRDQVLPAVAGAAENIVGGITGGFEKLGDILMGPFEFLADKILDAIKWPFETAFAPMVDTVAHKLDIPGKFARGEYGSIQEFTDDVMDPPVLDNITKVMGFFVGGIFSLLFGLFPGMRPLSDRLVQKANMDFPVRLLLEGTVLDAQLREIPVSHGYDEHLERWGYTDVDIAALRALRQQIPGSGDLVRFAVREAFDRTKAENLGFITPLPGDFALWMARQGFGEEWSERYWWAHWDLPSVTQGFEMLHRGVIEETDLEGLLIALDIPPKWIPRLLDVSYSPITRVDLRRLYQKGFIDEDRLERGYRDIGYNAENARALTDWTKEAYPRGGEGPPEDLRALTLSVIKQAYVRRIIERGEALDRLLDLEYSEEDAELTISIWDFDLEWNPSLRFEVPFKDLSRSVVTDAYRRGVFDFNRAAVELVEAGYTQDDAELLLQLEDLKLQQELTDMEIDLVLQEAKAQDITLAEAETRLLGLGLEPARVTFLTRREELRRMTKTRTLTVSQISRAFGAGIFTQDVFLEKVVALGYTEDDAAVLLGLEGPVEQAKRQLSRSEVERLLRRQEITPDDALGRLTAMGYLPEDAELIVGSVERQLERGLVERLLEQALLTRAEALDRLVKVGFSSADAELIVRSREQKMAEEAAEPEPEETPSRELSRTLVEKFLREGLLDREQALDRLVRAGFTRGDAELIILSVERKLAEEALET